MGLNPSRRWRPAARVRAASLALVLFLSACDGREPVVLGVAGPLRTGYGASMRLGAELAATEINAAGGIGGRPLRLRLVDDQADGDRAIAVADSLYADERVVGVVGHVNSGAMVAAAPSYQRGLAAVATSATSPQISRLGDWVFRVASSDSMNAVALARLARGEQGRVAVLYVNDDYGRGLAGAFRAAYAGDGRMVVESDPYTAATEDLRPYLRRMRTAGVGLVFIAGLEAEAARIIRQAREVGLGARFLGGDGLEGLVGMGAEFDGTMVGLLFHGDASPEARSFADRFRDAYRREPDGYAALGYDATRLLADAARQAGADRESIRDYLAGVGREGGAAAFQGASGAIRFDAEGDPLGKAYAVGVLRGGKIYLMENQ